MDTLRFRDIVAGRSPRHNTLVYDPGRCIGCGLCAEVCPHGVFSPPEATPVQVEAPILRGRPALRTARPSRVQPVARLLHPEDCMECGACQLNCPSEAITVESGVGCAIAMIRAALRGDAVETCGPTCCGEDAQPQRSEAEC